MIASTDRSVLVSSMGWIEHDALWVFDVDSGDSRVVPLESGADWLSLHPGAGSRFAVMHHYRDGKSSRITVHDFSSPSDALALAIIDVSGSRLTGDASVWADVPRLFVDYLAFGTWSDFVLLTVSPAVGRIEPQALLWYDESYDKGYQGVTGVLELPGEDFALVSVQRSSKLVKHDLTTGGSRGTVDIATGRFGGGNPHPVIRPTASEIWSNDYDALVVLDLRSQDVCSSRRLQNAADGTQLFIGDFAFSPDDSLCAVARPFSGDVIAVDPASLDVVGGVTLGEQPLELAMLSGNRIVARDWKTGGLLTGTLTLGQLPG